MGNLCMIQIKGFLKEFKKGIRVLDGTREGINVLDLFLDNEGKLVLEQYDAISKQTLNYKNPYCTEDNQEDLVLAELDSVKLWRLNEGHDMGELDFVSFDILNKFEVDKLVEMPTYTTVVEFANSNVIQIAYLADLN